VGPSRLARVAARCRALAVGSTVLFSAGSTACSDGAPSLILAATTSTYDSGLLESLVGDFQSSHPERSVRTIVVGSGEALELGKRGDVDVLIVHAPAAEDRFVREGHSARRTPLMINGFVLVGPEGDPAGVSGLDPVAALGRIASLGAAFVSRGDSSGTHERELALWREAGVTPERPWYLETGQGQGTSLQVASEREAYALTDRATFDVLSSILDLEPLVEGGPSLLNPYSVIVPTRAAHAVEAGELADWLTSEAGRQSIESFRLPRTNRPLFTPVGPEAAGGP